MKIITSLGIAVLIAGATSLALAHPTYADAGLSGDPIIRGTHKVWMTNYGMFKLKRFGEFCMPGQVIKAPMPPNAIVMSIETKECPGIPYRFRKVKYEDYFGWMWDFSLEVIDPLEGHLPPTDNQKVPILGKEEDLMGEQRNDRTD